MDRGWTKSCTTLKPWETIICWYLQVNQIIPGFLRRCRILCMHSRHRLHLWPLCFRKQRDLQWNSRARLHFARSLWKGRRYGSAMSSVTPMFSHDFSGAFLFLRGFPLKINNKLPSKTEIEFQWCHGFPCTSRPQQEVCLFVSPMAHGPLEPG